MSTSSVLIEERKKAYRYIKLVVDRIPAYTTDEITALADVLGGRFGLKDDLRALRDGDSNPTDILINAVRDLLGPTVPDFEISANLVEPFRSDT